jgi:hypothetical protein
MNERKERSLPYADVAQWLCNLGIKIRVRIVLWGSGQTVIPYWSPKNALFTTDRPRNDIDAHCDNRYFKEKGEHAMKRNGSRDFVAAVAIAFARGWSMIKRIWHPPESCKPRFSA